MRPHQSISPKHADVPALRSRRFGLDPLQSMLQLFQHALRVLFANSLHSRKEEADMLKLAQPDQQQRLFASEQRGYGLFGHGAGDDVHNVCNHLYCFNLFKPVISFRIFSFSDQRIRLLLLFHPFLQDDRFYQLLQDLHQAHIQQLSKDCHALVLAGLPGQLHCAVVLRQYLLNFCEVEPDLAFFGKTQGGCLDRAVVVVEVEVEQQCEVGDVRGHYFSGHELHPQDVLVFGALSTHLLRVVLLEDALLLAIDGLSTVQVQLLLFHSLPPPSLLVGHRIVEEDLILIAGARIQLHLEADFLFGLETQVAEVDLVQGQLLDYFFALFLLYYGGRLVHVYAADVGQVEGGFCPVEGEGGFVAFEEGGRGGVEAFFDGLDHAMDVQGQLLCAIVVVDEVVAVVALQHSHCHFLLYLRVTRLALLAVVGQSRRFCFVDVEGSSLNDAHALQPHRLRLQQHLIALEVEQHIFLQFNGEQPAGRMKKGVGVPIDMKKRGREGNSALLVAVAQGSWPALPRQMLWSVNLRQRSSLANTMRYLGQLGTTLPVSTTQYRCSRRSVGPVTQLQLYQCAR